MTEMYLAKDEDMMTSIIKFIVSLFSFNCNSYWVNNILALSIATIIIFCIFAIYWAFKNMFTCGHAGPLSSEKWVLGTIDPEQTVMTKGQILQELRYAASKLRSKDPIMEKRCIVLVNKFPEAVNIVLSPNMFTPFLRACWCGNYEVVSYMLKCGADITLRTEDGESPLYLAVYYITRSQQVWDPSVLNVLYEAGCDVNARKRRGYTALHLAARSGNLALIRWLLVHGANPELKCCCCGNEPVDIARSKRHNAAIILLTVTPNPEKPGLRKLSTSAHF